ncbi:hypothetical protein [Streptomyces sp. H62]
MDDFALYSDVYGTLLVDADTRLPIELWAGRDASNWPPGRGRTPVLTWTAGTARWSTTVAGVVAYDEGKETDQAELSAVDVAGFDDSSV